ncbi:MAG: ATP-binding protein [Bacteroidota bacterium]
MQIIRNVQQEIDNHFFKGKAIILFGARQTGKSTIVEMILQKRTEPILRLNGDDSDVREMLKNPNVQMLKNIIGENKILFIDEAQSIENIGTAIKIIVDRIPDVQVVATGSSSFELANKTNEPLTGRKYEFLLFPLSFSENSKYFGFLDEKRMLENRLVFGSYPEIVSKPNEAEKHLRLLANSYLYKDILMLSDIKKPVLVDKILKALALQVGNEVSYNEVAQIVGADKETVEKYIDILEKAFIVFRLPALSGNIRNELKKSRKIYFYDNGIRNSIIGNYNSINTRTDIGVLWENFMVSELYKRNIYNNLHRVHYFWRTTSQQEVDYIEMDGDSYYAYEFKWNPKAKAKIPLTFSKNYAVKQSFVVTPSNYSELL